MSDDITVEQAIEALRRATEEGYHSRKCLGDLERRFREMKDERDELLLSMQQIRGVLGAQLGESVVDAAKRLRGEASGGDLMKAIRDAREHHFKLSRDFDSMQKRYDAVATQRDILVAEGERLRKQVDALEVENEKLRKQAAAPSGLALVDALTSRLNSIEVKQDRILDAVERRGRVEASDDLVAYMTGKQTRETFTDFVQEYARLALNGERRSVYVGKHVLYVARDGVKDDTVVIRDEFGAINYVALPVDVTYENLSAVFPWIKSEVL